MGRIKKERNCKISSKKFPIDFPKIRPENAAGSYLLSKHFTKSIENIYPTSNQVRACSLKYNSWKKKDSKEATLKWKRNISVRCKEELDVVKNLWIERAEEIKQLFIRYDDFVNLNSEKRGRTRMKILNEFKIQEKRNEDIEKLKIDYEKLLAIKILMENEVKSLKTYEDYLGEVAKNDNFKNINNILVRFYDLMSTKQLVAKKITVNLETLSNLKCDLAKLIAEKQTKLNGLSHHLNQIYRRYENARKNSFRWEDIVLRIQNVCVVKRAEHVQLKEAIWNWYLKVCEMRREKPTFKKQDIEYQLEFIRNKFTELVMVNTKLAEGSKRINQFI